MSRLIVKNIPNGISEEKLKNIFSKKGIITDVQLKYTKDGKFRNFGFIGYETEKSATDAQNYFNNTCINTNRIEVELCSALGAEDKPKAWSKYAKDSSAYKSINGIVKEKPIKEVKKKVDSAVEDIINEHKDDPLFLEFMQVHTKGSNIWNNDMLLPEKEKKKDKPIEIVEEMVEEPKIEENPTKIPDINYFTLKLINTPYRIKRADIAKFFNPLKPSSIRIPTNSHGFCFVGFKTQKDMNKALLKNKSFIKKNQIQIVEFTEKNRNEGKKDEKKLTNNSTEISLQNIEEISESGRIFFKNLARTVQEEELQKLFEKFGPISEISLPINFETKKIKCFGTVTFLIPEHAVVAYNKLDGTILQGRMLHLLPAKSLDKIEPDLNSLTFKKKKILQQKQNAGNSVNWNTLFMGSNAVADALASNYGTTKAQILDVAGGGSNAAVRLALGETEIVMNMKKYLEEHGVYLDAFNQKSAELSKLIIIAKNLPVETTKEEVYQIFSPFGLISQIILPPLGITAIIEFTEISEARTAFKRLAYSKFKNAPLYLEWAPVNTFKPDAIKTPLEEFNKPEETKEIILKEKSKKSIVKIEDEDIKLDDNEHVEDGATLFIRNLNYNSTEDTIKEYFKNIGTIHAIEISKKKNPQNPLEKVSLGYGFIQFKKRKSADKAFKDMQFTIIEGNQVELKRSDKILKTTTLKYEETPKETDDKINNFEEKSNEIKHEEDDDEPAEEGATLFLKNLNFSTREHTVREHFNHIGSIYAIDIAKKKDPDNPVQRISLGYGFIQFKKRMSSDKALKEMQFTVIDGNTIELKRSDKYLKVHTPKSKRITENTSQQTGTKILIKNIPFQAKTSEIQQIFKAFGGLKSVRVPMKNVGGEESHRGFGFVEFVTKSDAKKAFDAVGQSTHLYGRRLALLWANVDESVDQLRKRTADHFNSSTNKGSKKGLFDTAGISNKVDENIDEDE